MKIGQVAHDAGVSVDTVRFYERRGVLPAPQRSASGRRVYTTATVRRIRLAKTLQHLGFTLAEVIDALHAHDSGTTDHETRGGASMPSPSASTPGSASSTRPGGS